MELKALNFVCNINFGEKTNTSIEPIEETVHTDLVKSPEKDVLEKSNEETDSKSKNKKLGLGAKIAIGLVSTILLIYGGVVLKRKLSKPSFEEVQKCFKEIFEKDLSKDEVNVLIKKYKEICRNGNTEEFTKKMIEELKKDYGIEKVVTDLKVTKLKDNKLKTALEYTEAGNASPLGEINIMPRTHNDTIIRSIQQDTFSTGFHELKHMRQFADAYCANPDKFAEAIYKRNVSEQAIMDSVNETKEFVLEEAKKLKNTSCKEFELDDIIRQLRKNSGFETDAELRNKVIEATKKDIRKLLDARYGKMERFKEGSKEYERGMKYIQGYEEYPNYKVDREAYLNNILEKEAWHIGDLADKIYKYVSSIWKL